MHPWPAVRDQRYIAVVEWRQEDRLLLRGMLKSYDLRTYATLDDALRDRGTPDLLLIDAEIPGGPSKTELTWIIRADPRYKAIPIVGLTSYTMDQKENACFSGMIVKPFNYAGMAGTIEGLLLRKNPKV